MAEVTVRRIGPEALAELQSISRRTFSETFALHNTQADLDAYLRERLGGDRLARELGDPDSFFFFATVDGAVAGYMKLNRGAAQTEAQGDDAMELERLYVDRAFHGRGVAPLLLEAGIALASASGFGRLWLGVWEENARAIAFYEKHGFATFGEHVFQLGSDAQRDLLMQCTLPA